MGRKTDALLRGFRAAKCLTVLKLASSRIKVHRNKRSASAKQMRAEIAQLLKTGQEAQVYITKAEALIKQENMVAVYDIIDQYCHAIIGRFPMIEMQSNCPIDMKEPIASLIFAAPRCVELSELATIKEAFTAKYGKEFAAAAAELRPDCGVNKRVIELLSIRPATAEMKLKIMKEICAEYKVNWTPGEALAESSTSSQAGSSQQPVKTNVEATKVTGEAGTSKATIAQAAPSKVNETAPSNLSSATKPAMPGGFKPEGIAKPGKAEQINKPGLAAVITPMKPVVLIPGASKPSGPKHGLASQQGPEKASASVPQSVKGAANTAIASVKAGLAAAGSSKAGGGAVFATNVFQTNGRKEESAEAVGVQSSQGVIYTGSSSAVSASSKESVGKPIAKAEVYVQPVVSPQDGLSDSDNDSFVSVEEGRFEDDAEASSMGGASRRESFGKNSLQASLGHGPSLVTNPSRERPHEDVYSKASSKKSSFTLESSQEVMLAKASGKNSLNTDALHDERPLRAESRKNSLREEKKGNDTIMESLITDAVQQEKPFRAESRKSSLGEEKSTGLFSESLKTEAFQEEKVFRAESLKTEAVQEEKPFRAESRKSSLGEEKSSDLIMNTDALLEEKVLRAESRKSSGSMMESSLEDMYSRASSKNSSASGIPQEEKVFKAGSKKSSLKEKNLIEKESFKHVEENNLRKQQQGEAQHFEENVEEGLQRKKSSRGEEYPFEEQENRMTVGDGLQENVLTEDSFTAESLRVEKLVESKKTMSLSDGISVEGMSSWAGEEVSGKVSSSAIVQSPESVNTQSDEVPPIVKGVPEVPGSASLGDLATPDHFAAAAKAISAEGAFGALATPDDFAAAAKAVAAEAARLAVLDYAKRIAGSGAIPVDLTDLTKFGLDFNGGLQATEELHSESKSNITNDSKEGREGGDITNDVKEEASKMIGGMGYADLENSMLSKTTSADDGASGYNASSNPLGQAGSLAKDDSLQQPDMDSGSYEFNPFATEVDKAPDSRFSGGEDDSSSWAKPESINKAGGFVQEEDHLDIFFRRKTPMFDEDGGYSYAKLNPSLLEEKAPYFGYGKTERNSQDKFFVSPTPVFDSFSERQNVVVEESSGLFKGPVFDGGSKQYDASFSFDDGLDKKSSSVGLSDQSIPQFDMEASARFDSEPEPLFDKVEEEEEQSIIQKSEPAQQVGQLKWQSKKPTKASEEATNEETLRDSSKPMSRRTRKKPQRDEEYGYGSEIPAQSKLTSKWPEGSSSSLMQQQRKEQGRYDTADEEGNLRTKPAESFADAMGKRPARSPERVAYDLSKENQSDRWDSISSVGDRFSTINRKKSPTRSSQRQKVPLEESDEDFYFSEDIINNPARSNVSKTSKPPTRMAKQQVLSQGYDDDAEAYRFSNQPPRIPNFSRQDLADDDSFEEPPVARYKPYRQNDELSIDSSSNLAMYRQKPHRQQEDYYSEGARMQYVQASGVGKSSPSSRPSARQKQQYVEDEDDLVSGYKPAVQVDGRSKTSSTRPLSSRTKFEEEKQYLSPRYKPSAQVSDVGRASSSPLSGRRQRYQRLQEEEQEVSMEEYEKEEFYSKPLPDRRQGDHRKGHEGIPRPRYGQKQGLRLEEENSDSSAEDYEQEQEEQRRPSILSEQEKPRRRLPVHGQEKPQWPLPVSHEYEEEERMPRARYGRKQDLRVEEEDPDFRMGDYGHPILSEPGNEAKRRPLPSHRQQEQRRRPSSAFYDQEEEYESMQLPDWRQEERRKEERMPRPLHGQQQDSRLEKGTLDLSEEDSEEYREEQEQGGQGKQGRQRRENQHRPLPPLHQYEHEEEKNEFDAIPLPDRRQEERHKEKKPISRPSYGKEKEPASRPVYEHTQNSRPEKANVNLSMEDYEQQHEEPGLTSLSSAEQEQYGQEKHRRPSPPRQTDLKPGKDNPESWKQEKIQQEQRRPSSDRQQQQSSAEEVARKGQQGREERLPSPVYTRPQEVQEEKKISELSIEHDELPKAEPLQQSAAVPEEKQEQGGQGKEKKPWPLRNRKQESKEDIKEQLPARQSLPKDEGMKVSQDKPEAKAKPSPRRPTSKLTPPDSPSLESSISDPVVLATIPPPVKKPSIKRPPEATTLESSLSSPSPATPAEVKVPKVAPKLPNVDDLLANFEAFQRARKGE